MSKVYTQVAQVIFLGLFKKIEFILLITLNTRQRSQRNVETNDSRSITRVKLRHEPRNQNTGVLILFLLFSQITAYR